MKVLLVSPATPDTFWSLKHAVSFIFKKAAYPPLGLLTVAGMLPRQWELRLVDLNVSRLSDADIDWADYVFISAMLVQAESTRRVIARVRARHKTLVAGGPLFTTGHERFPDVQHFVIGEAENIIAALIRDMISGQLKQIYQAPDKPDLSATPVPRWDLIPFKDYATMLVQFSRGCPFNCEFCDIIVMYGRVPRVKTPAQMIAELNALADAGWKGPVFIVDDNFIGNKVKAKTFLRELIRWRSVRAVGFTFTTEASLNLVDDPELLDLMVQAGFKKVFIGIETIEEDSLLECEKVQNVQRDVLAAVKTIHNAGIEVMGGFIVGFDSDRETTFGRMRSFIEEAGVVTAMVGLLNALPQTRLFQRLKAEGRILCESTGNNVEAVLNFMPKMDRRVLVDGYRAMVKYLYTPKAYYRRALTFLGEYRPRGPRTLPTCRDVLAFIRSLWIMGVWTPGRMEYWKYVTKSLLSHPRAFGEAINLAIVGHHFRRIAANL
jgi:radical SAM superfamily enzyme YgiQ (UPF0313 family)